MNAKDAAGNLFVKSKQMTIFIVIFSIISIATISSLIMLNTQLKEENKRLTQIEEQLKNNEYKSDEQPVIDENYINEEDAKLIAKEETEALETKIKDNNYATNYQLNIKYNDLLSKINNLNTSSGGGSTTVVNQTTGVEYDDIKTQIRDDFFPVGSLYCSMDKNFDPNTAWGGTWTKLDEGYFVEATQDENKVNTQILAGLPNIIGSADLWWGDYTYGSVIFRPGNLTDAFYATRKDSSIKLLTSGETRTNTGYNHIININASLGETKTDGSVKASSDYHVYGKSDTVQPNAYYAYIWRRDN